MKTYGGPRNFRGLSLDAIAERLDRAFEELDRCIREAVAGITRRWEKIETVRGNATVATKVVAKAGVLLECDTEDATAATPGPSIVVTLPPVNRADAGLESAIVRRHAAGTITLVPIDGALLDGAATAQSVPAVAGCYVLVITTRGYWLRR